jgi:hypothetical protein
VKSCIQLDTLILNPDHKIDSNHFILNGQDPIPFFLSLHFDMTFKIIIGLKFNNNLF